MRNKKQNDRSYRVAADAAGTLIADVEADSPEEALKKAQEESLDWRLADDPEPGEMTSVMHLESKREWEVEHTHCQRCGQVLPPDSGFKLKEPG